MRGTDLVASLVRNGAAPTQRCECARQGCSNTFVITEGLAFPGKGSDGEVHLYFWCSPICYLDAMPAQACWSA